ncbi:hypothetical protein [Roseateles sp.]|uniref:hypothetical protein n=1 Tax=Roseateles sp. TaxID=1971397 RepID=UPI0025E5A7F1|nr:hypothetical protein [Roseateles sp.]MBV8035638.1 hypothetical protein [Roseateles sp.]
MLQRLRSLAFLLAACAAGAAPAADEDFIRVLGRADADASGGLPVLLWVRNGALSSVTLRAPRLLARQDEDPCPASLRWAWQSSLPRPDHAPPEIEALQHSACTARDCSHDALRLVLGQATADELPLDRLLPGFATVQAEWLVLYVVGLDADLGLDGIPQSRLPWTPKAGRLEAVMPLAAAAHFPELHTALLAYAATARALAQSVVMRSERVGMQPLKFARFRFSDATQLQALGLTDDALGMHHVIRLLLRLHPEDRPATLRPRAASGAQVERMAPLRALGPWQGSAESCRSRIDQLRREPACTARIAELRQSPEQRFHVARSLSASTETAQLQQACMTDCALQKQQQLAAVERSFEAVGERQQRAWQWVEALTGRPAASWPAR